MARKQASAVVLLVFRVTVTGTVRLSRMDVLLILTHTRPSYKLGFTEFLAS